MIQNISTKTWDGLRSTGFGPAFGRFGVVSLLLSGGWRTKASFCGGPTNNEEAWSDTAYRNQIDVCAQEIFWGSTVHQAVLPRSPTQQSRSLDFMAHMRGLVSSSGRTLLIYRHCGSRLHPRYSAPSHAIQCESRTSFMVACRMENAWYWRFPRHRVVIRLLNTRCNYC